MTKIMQKQLNISEDYLRKADKGGTHKRWAWGGIPIGMYNYAGTLEREFEDIYDAIANCGLDGVTYKGIVACCEGKIRTHAKRIWRKDCPDDLFLGERAIKDTADNESPIDV